MTVTQKVILIALVAIGALCLIVGLTLMHYIGGFLRTVEEESREQEEKTEEGGIPREDPGEEDDEAKNG